MTTQHFHIKIEPLAIEGLTVYERDARLHSPAQTNRLVQGRTALGITQKDAAHRMRVDPSTLARWERGEREPSGAFSARALRFLADGEAKLSAAVARIA
jgi:DNA-binding transcriptional regulator YiaG